MKDFDDAMVRMDAKMLVQRINLYTEQISEIQKMLDKELADNPFYKNIKTLPGVGSSLSLTLFLEVCEISRLNSASSFSSYCRVVPGVAQSGNKTAGGRNNKKGNPYIKSALSQAAVAAVRCYKPISNYYEDHLQRRQGKGGKMVCYNIIAHKLAIATYKTLKGETIDQNRLFPMNEAV